MKDLVITLSSEAKEVIKEQDVRNMLRALNKSVYLDELYVDIANLRSLIEKARAAEASRNRYVEAWNIAFKKLK